MNIKKRILLFLLPAAVLLYGCEDLEVENLNQATLADVLANPADYPGIIDGAFYTWFNAMHKEEPQMSLLVGGQIGTASWGNWGMQDVGTIPRLPLPNTLTWNNRGIFTRGWNLLNNSLAQSNEVLRVMNEVYAGRAVNPETGEDITNSVVGNAKVVQGMNLIWLALYYDQAFIADENVAPDQLAQLELRPYQEVFAAGLQKMEEAAAIFAANPQLSITGLSGVTFTGQNAVRFINTFSAKAMVNMARTSAETSAVNWSRVLQLTNNGIQTDVAPAGDGGFQWWSRQLVQGQNAGWVRISQRLIAMLEGAKSGPTWNPDDIDPFHPTAPYPFPGSLASQTPTANAGRITNPRDNRINTDMIWSGNAPHQAARGYYFFGNYTWGRYQYFSRDQFIGPIPLYRTVENDLLRAEALVRTGGSKSVAADLVNQTRVTRGGLTPATAGMSDAQLLDAIMYERMIELGYDGTMNGWLYRRGSTVRAHQLHEGTPRHMPIPAAELEILGIPRYSFGGVGNEM